MTISLTTNAENSSQKTKKEPSIVLVFDGITEVFGSATILSPILIGQAGLEVGGFTIGAKQELASQINSISFESAGGESTGTRINYNISPDLGVAEAVSSLKVALVDTQANEILTLLANNEFLGRKVRIRLSPDSTDTTYPDDYITIFRGIVDDIKTPPGAVVFNIAHPDQKKRQTIYNSWEDELAEDLDASETSIDLVDASGLLEPITGPDGAEDSAFSTYIQVNDEVIQYTGISTNTLTGCTRGALDSTAATHTTGDSIKSFYRLNDNVIDAALKIMLSGWAGPFVEDVAVTSVEYISSELSVDNALYFEGVDVEEEYGLTAGDYITTTGSAEGANNVTLKTIASITNTGLGSYIVIDGVTFTEETTTTAVVDFRSKYDTLPDGLRMSPDEVDVAEHERLRTLFLSSFSHDIYIKDTIESGKDFIGDELYKPIACYSVPRQARSSVAYTIGPLPTQSIKVLDSSNVLNAEKLGKRRSLGRNFYNTIIYKYDESAPFEKFLQGYVTTNATSKTQIPVGTRAFIIESKGLRASNVVQSSATRLLNRYAFGANYIENVEVDFRTGFNLEISDLVILDGVSLQINDASTGSDTSPLKFYEVVGKDFNFKTGKSTLSLVDTNFTGANRYALISPASRIRTGISASSFVIESSYADTGNEFEKWDSYGEIYVRVRSDDYASAATAQIQSFSGNTVTLQSGLGFTPVSGMIMELSDYAQGTDEIQLLYAFISNGSANFADGEAAYSMV